MIKILVSPRSMIPRGKRSGLPVDSLQDLDSAILRESYYMGQYGGTAPSCFAGTWPTIAAAIDAFHERYDYMEWFLVAFDTSPDQ